MQGLLDQTQFGLAQGGLVADPRLIGAGLPAFFQAEQRGVEQRGPLGQGLDIAIGGRDDPGGRGRSRVALTRLSARRLCSCKRRAATSLPATVSPRIGTVDGMAASAAKSRACLQQAGLAPAAEIDPGWIHQSFLEGSGALQGYARSIARTV